MGRVCVLVCELYHVTSDFQQNESTVAVKAARVCVCVRVCVCLMYAVTHMLIWSILYFININNLGAP